MDYNLFRNTLIVFSLLNLISGSTISPEVISEKTILLEIKKSLTDSSGILSSWNSTSSDHCSWFGVSCDSKSRVIAVKIKGCDQSGILRSPSRSDGKIRACDGGNSKLAGKISPFVGKLEQLRVLSLSSNNLSGEIPREIWGLEKLNVLDLEGNNFTGKLPNRIPGSRDLRVLNLGFNQITGNISLSLKKCNQLESLNLSGNKLEGSIPSFLGDFRKLTRLDLSNNQLNGPIPPRFELNVRCFKHLDLSGNYLNHLIRNSRDSVYCHTGNIFWKHRKLASFNGEDAVSQEGTRSDSDGESESAAPPPAANSGLNPIEIASISSASAIVSVLLALAILLIYARKWNRNSKVEVVESKEIRVFLDIGIPLAYEDIVRATGNFSNSNCIGHGGFGSTYKAEISPGTFLAVKKLSVGRFQGVQQFDAEIMALEMVRHRNLVKLIGFHTSRTEMFLIYNYLPGGNLEDFIKERPKAALEWKIIHKISFHVARALAYLHDRCSPKVLHRDVKPSNILLDNDFNAFLSDFGLSRLLSCSQTHATTGVAGTFGYVAPEYAMTCRVSEKADVYSYGIVLLELLSDKKALDPSFSSHENGFNIVFWAHMKLRQGKAKDVFTAGLWESGPHDDLVEVLHLALKCTVESLSTRPMMKYVVQRLKQLKPS